MLADFEKLEKPEKYLSDEEMIKKELYAALDKSVRNLVKKEKKVAVAFSGGLDSSIIAYLVSKYAEPVLFCVGFKNSHDVVQAQKSFELLKSWRGKLSEMSSPNQVQGKNWSKAEDPVEKNSALYKDALWQTQSDEYREKKFPDNLPFIQLNIIYLDGLDLKKYFDKTVELIGTKDRLIADLNAPLYIILEKTKQLGFKNLMLGQGADTLFGGFARYPNSENFESEIFDDIKNIGKTNLFYNLKILEKFNMQALYPFLDKDVVELGIFVSPDLKIKANVQKYILRETFRNCLPVEIVELKKKSFQYGSGIHKALGEINKGFMKQTL